jgi:hypothetical protein
MIHNMRFVARARPCSPSWSIAAWSSVPHAALPDLMRTSRRASFLAQTLDSDVPEVMGDSPLTPVDTASAVLALSKATWRLGTSFSKLTHDAKPVDSALKNLAEDIKSLSTECDLIYAKLDELTGRGSNESPLPYVGDGRIFDCLTLQVREASQTIQELEQFVRSGRMEETEEVSLVYHPQHLVQLNKSLDQIEEMGNDVRRHTDNLRITLLLIQT